MLTASNLPKAINISKTTAPHAASYLISLFNVSHYQVVSLFFENF